MRQNRQFPKSMYRSVYSTFCLKTTLKLRPHNSGLINVLTINGKHFKHVHEEGSYAD